MLFEQQYKVYCLAQFLHELMQSQSMTIVFYLIWLIGWTFFWTGYKWSFLFITLCKIFSSKVWLFNSSRFNISSAWEPFICRTGAWGICWTGANCCLHITATTWLHVSPMPAIQVQWHDRILTHFSKIIHGLWNQSLTDCDFLHSTFKSQKLLPVRLWYNSGCNVPNWWCHHKWNESSLLAINMVYASCLTSCRTA